MSINDRESEVYLHRSKLLASITLNTWIETIVFDMGSRCTNVDAKYGNLYHQLLVCVSRPEE